MSVKNLISLIFSTLTVTSLAVVSCAASASAATIYWTDWISSNDTNGFTGFGTITTPTSTVNVNYNNPQGIAIFQANEGTDYWTSDGVRNPAASPYTNSFVDNIPTGTDIIQLQYAGTQSLHFSEAIAKPIFSYVSLNDNGYAFNQDFDILSFGDSSDGNACGYWGCGTSYKQVVDFGGGNFEYQLLGTGEPHGTIRFKGTFDTLSWRSLSSETWNGFTVGIEEIVKDVHTNTSIPEPASVLALLGFGVLGGTSLKRKQN
jgi:hypothetical protein